MENKIRTISLEEIRRMLNRDLNDEEKELLKEYIRHAIDSGALKSVRLKDGTVINFEFNK